ncbi:MAG: hypothetical protein AAFY28_01095 [Actinomycetota bacterium]
MSGDSFDRYGGSIDVAFHDTGRFRTDTDEEGRHWLITPDGNRFFSHGVQCVTSVGGEIASGDAPYEENVLRRHGTKATWRENTLRLLQRAGLNTLGDWSQIEFFASCLPYVTSVKLTPYAPEVPNGPAPFRGRARDFFDPGFEAGVRSEVAGLGAVVDDPFCIGVFLDDELSWSAGPLMPLPYLDYYLHLPAMAPGKRALQDFFAHRYDNVDAFNAVWATNFAEFDEIQDLNPTEGTMQSVGRPWTGNPKQQADRAGFRCVVAERVLGIASAAMRDLAPGVLNLGPRFLAGNLTPDVVALAAEHVDVLSVNAFDVAPECVDLFKRFEWTGALIPEPLFHDVRHIATAVDAPILLSSFTYRASVDGLNDFPPATVFEVLPSQQMRAERYATYMSEALTIPQVVGAHWFQHHDQPAEGRFDGENSNFGIVSIEDEPYEPMIAAMANVSRRIYGRHDEDEQ